MRSRIFITILTLCFVAMGVMACGGGATSGAGSKADSSIVEDGNMLTVRLPLTQDSMAVTKASDMDEWVPLRSYDTIRMGRMSQGDVLEGRFKIVNVSDKPLVIIQVITGCGCTSLDYDTAPVAPNSSLDVVWRFDSKGRLGKQFSAIEIITSSKQCATVYLDGDIYIQEK